MTTTEKLEAKAELQADWYVRDIEFPDHMKGLKDIIRDLYARAFKSGVYETLMEVDNETTKAV